ncbi:MAG: exodeoxyribonuclease VII large subunit [Candidatus Saccharimonadaceae bacterium]
MENVQLSVSDFVALINQTLEYAYPSVTVVGEVAEFRISQGKWVSFKLKDAGAVIDCFMGIYQLRMPIEDGMKIMVVAAPKLSPKWGKFSLNIRTVKPVGEGSIKKGFELLKAKLEAEGLFAPERKRVLPRVPSYVGVISSTESAGYADFCKIINERWGGMSVEVAHTQVQGEPAADQIIRAIKYFNNLEVLPEVLVIIRGGGSAEDLMTFNDELLAREIASSRIPTLVGVGHEVDHTLADMIADRRAATPTNAAEILVPDRREIIRAAHQQATSLGHQLVQAIDQYSQRSKDQLDAAFRRIREKLDDTFERLGSLRVAVAQLNPENVLKRGYALVRGEVQAGSDIEIETYASYITAEVKDVRSK